MALTSFIRYGHPPLVVAALFVLCSLAAHAQEERFYRIWLQDKGTPDRILLPSDPWYDAATAHLSERALRRRAKVLPFDSLVSTADLPIFEDYRRALLDIGLEIRQSSRWFNTVMIRTDSVTYEQVRLLPFVDSVSVMGSARTGGPPVGKRLVDPEAVGSASPASLQYANEGCITNRYGLSTRQNRAVRFDAPHSTGIAGEGVLIGILDAGFDWRNHEVIADARVIAEYDFVNHDSITYDEEGEVVSEPHGTYVMSLIAGYLPESIVGGAFRASFALAKTEDVRSESHIEEDNFVAGLEWLEALGADITSTSLGYTTFDPPEAPHSLETDLDGKTAFGSRGVNYATHLGLLCVLSAGNEYSTFRYVGVPAEADSALAVAALDTAGNAAPFSSRGSSQWKRVKPDIGAPGTVIYGAQSAAENAVGPSQGTSSAAPIAASVAALLLSANPELTPWQIRQILYETSGSASSPDTSIGYGIVNANRAISRLTRLGSIAGEPKVLAYKGSLSIISWIIYGEPSQIDIPSPSTGLSRLKVAITNRRTQRTVSTEGLQPEHGLARWLIPGGADELEMLPGDSLSVEIVGSPSGELLRHTLLSATDGLALPESTLCKEAPLPTTSLAVARPNPFYDATRIEFALDHEARISLDIFSVIGEQVISLVRNEVRQPGFYSDLLIPNDLPSGAYYYRLQVDNDVFYEKMIRLR